MGKRITLLIMWIFQSLIMLEYCYLGTYVYTFLLISSFNLCSYFLSLPVQGLNLVVT